MPSSPITRAAPAARSAWISMLSTDPVRWARQAAKNRCQFRSRARARHAPARVPAGSGPRVLAYACIARGRSVSERPRMRPGDTLRARTFRAGRQRAQNSSTRESRTSQVRTCCSIICRRAASILAFITIMVNRCGSQYKRGICCPRPSNPTKLKVPGHGLEGDDRPDDGPDDRCRSAGVVAAVPR